MFEQIRPAVPSDRASVEAIVEAAYGHYVARIGRKPGPMLDDYAAYIGQGLVHVLERKGRIDGFVILIPEADAMLLHNIAVRPAAQGAGLGRLLLAFAEFLTLEAGHLVLRLYTHRLMTENIAIYARGGFIETHRAQEGGFDRVFMRKRLGA